ncbi:MAG: hypothetical protein BGO25_11770 [Acidobacteriales bacterium 59-55]|nr:MAG: hypothetical protein BGO25_11770 [Acidobacteriales bacterium 59-55]
MQYQVSRNGQMYGPYTIEDLQRYVASGHILYTDMAKSEDMAEWLPVSRILGAPSAYAASAPYAYAPPAGVPYPDPPDLHWGLVLLFAILTCGLFALAWDFVQVLWIKKVQPDTKAMMYFLIYAVLWLLNLGSSAGNIKVGMHGGAPHTSPTAGLISLAALVFLIVYRFSMRNSLERHFNGPEPLGLRLGGVMTFFFGGLYFQYHFNRINEMKETLRYRNQAR